jgi:hypothetical protein
MTYARIITETAIDRNPPRRATIDGRAVAGELPAEYLATLGYYPLDESAPAPTPQDGYHAEPRYAYDSDEKPTRIVQSWEVVQDAPPPPVDYSKRALYRVFQSRGVWPTVKAWMESQGCWEDWEYATTLASDDPLMATAIPAIRQLLGVTDAEMRKILESCEV